MESIPSARFVDRELAQPTTAMEVVAPKPVVAAPDHGAQHQVIDIASIEEHRGKTGPVWKVTTNNDEVFAVLDDIIVGDISDAKAADRPVKVEWQQRGTKRVILSVCAVSE